MKSLFKYFLVAVFFTTLVPLSSCKKGANDPFLSLRSRTSRLAGTWNLTASDYTTTTVQKNKIGATVTTTTRVDHYVFDGAKLTTTTTITIGNSTPATNTNSITHSEIITVDKANTFTMVTVYGSNTSTASGSWAWLKKDKAADLKNKEAVVFLTDKYIDGNTSTNGSTDAPEVMVLDELKNSSMVVILDSFSDDGQGDNGTKRTTTGTRTYQQ